MQAQSYPTHPVRIIVGYPAGGPIDILARLLTPGLTEAFGQQFIVDNRPGASGMIGNEQVAKAAPDGHTLLMTAATFAINPSVFAKVAYDPQRDFAPIAMTARSPSGTERVGSSSSRLANRSSASPVESGWESLEPSR